ncbi:MAG: hypothetical protein EBX52_03875 [Proteobacteria bacterium]|nr:hypothetical protein [Pseudomonadota bacterium]
MDFGRYVDQLESLYLSSGGAAPRPEPLRTVLAEVPKRILLVPPHPDDECLMAGLALRARNEAGSEVLVLSFGYGSLESRRAERRKEQDEALQTLGFDRVEPNGCSGAGGHHEISHGQILSVLEAANPDAVIIPHGEDFHPTHVRCSKTARAAVFQHVENTGSSLSLYETEYWQPMLNPNLLLPLPASVVKTMGNALQRHAGEVSRNPYHLTLPAWLMDQERRGSERVHGAGVRAGRSSIFSQLYRFTRVSSGVTAGVSS